MSFKIKTELNLKPKTEPSEGNLMSKSNGFIKDPAVIVIRLCTCFVSPNGDFGLNGFFQGKNYNCRRMGKDKKGRAYYRIWKDYHNFPEQYSTIIAFEFQYYFKIPGYNMDDERGAPPARSQRK